MILGVGFFLFCEVYLKIDHAKLIKSLRTAHSAERAACFAYVGHAGSLKDAEEVLAVQQIEQDEWDHRAEVLAIMKEYDIRFLGGMR